MSARGQQSEAQLEYLNQNGTSRNGKDGLRRGHAGSGGMGGRGEGRGTPAFKADH